MTASNAFLWAYVFKPALLIAVLYFGIPLIAYVLNWRPAPSRENVYKKLQSDVSMAQAGRTAEKIGVLVAIRATQSDEKRAVLWEQYHVLDAKDQALTLQERDQLVAASGFTISEKEQYELDHGINPYKKVK